jgi:hypothetical protein
MEPVILVHGYSAEGDSSEPAAVARIFGTLQDDLKKMFSGPPVLDVNISRYISLDDGVDLDDITLAFDRALKSDFPDLVAHGFNAIVHSTGALVLRNWVRRFSSTRPSSCRRIVHLAGANLGSGWAHVGESTLAKWLRFVGQGGKERGLAVLDGLELGSNWALALHYHFLTPGNSMLEDYGVMEFSLVGSQPMPESMIIPVRYGREDGSDGVVRVAASNLNHHYIRVGPSRAPEDVKWEDAAEFSERTVNASAQGNLADFTGADTIFAGNYYKLLEQSLPGEAPIWDAAAGRVRPVIPFAIPYGCAHTSTEMGIVSGTQTRVEVLDLIRQALTCADPAAYAALVTAFTDHTARTYDRVRNPQHRETLQTLFSRVTNFLLRPESQYDRHAQVSVRVRDQHGKAIDDYSVHFNSFGGGSGQGQVAANDLFEDTHKNRTSPDTTTFYLRLESWDGTARDWVDRLAKVNGVDLEIDCIDPKTQRIVFVPLRMRLNANLLARYLKPHRATLFDVILQRLPAQETFSMYSRWG